MYRFTLTLTRPNTTVPWFDPQSDGDIFEFLSSAAKHNVAVIQQFSDDNLISKIVFSSYTKEDWDNFASKYVFRDGKIGDSWYLLNDISYTTTEETF